MNDPGPRAAAGLCRDCRHGEVVASPRSRFLRCRRADTDLRFAKYPTLPVVACGGYEPLPGGERRLLRSAATSSSS